MKMILVTGASKGIGRSICNLFASKSYCVLFTCRSDKNIVSLEKEFKEAGASCARGFILDIRNERETKKLASAIYNGYEKLDVLVNNAGLGSFKSVMEISKSEWDGLIGTNLSGVFYLTKSMLPLMIPNKRGNIINIGSLASRNTFPGGALYCASKFGLLGFTECLMLDVRKYGIKVSIVMPGSVNTTFNGRQMLEEEENWKLSSDDVSKAVWDIVSSEGNSLISRVELRPSIPK